MLRTKETRTDKGVRISFLDGSNDENPGGIGDGEFPELKKEYDDNQGHREGVWEKQVLRL